MIGCNTCRQRRVKCDEGRPTCQRCRRTGYQCEGYVRKHRFVDEVSRTIRDARKTEATPSDADSPKASPIRVQRPRSKVPLDLNLSAFESDLYVSFLLSNLCLGVIMPTLMMRTQAEDTSCALAQLSIRALSAAYFGRIHKQYDIINQSALLYGEALRHLIIELRDPERARSLSTLSSSITLQTYEVCSSIATLTSISLLYGQFVAAKSTSGWLDHASGIGKLIELRGLQGYQTRLERDIFEANRVNIVIESSLRNKRCFLEQIEWKTRPWATDPESKDTMSYLIDILCDLPGLKEDVAMLLNPGKNNATSHQKLSMSIGDHITQLYAVRYRWETENPNACVELSVDEHQLKQPLFSSTFHFSSVRQANEILLYNIALIIYWKMGLEVIGPTFRADALAFGLSSIASEGPLLLPGEATNLPMVGREICRCVEYYLSDCHNRTGFYLFVALTVAYIAFQPTSIEAEWVDKTMSQVADLNGFEIVKSCGPMWI